MNRVPVPNSRSATDAGADIPNLDALRAIAVLLVLADHGLETIGHTIGASYHPYDWYLGRLGVLLFFVHTAYVLFASMQRLGTSGWTLTRAFYIRRAFRIYPLALFCIALVLLFGVPPLPWEQYVQLDAPALVSNALLTSNITGTPQVLAPMWSLPIEVQMYLLLPVIYLYSDRAADLRKIAAMYVAAVALGWVLPAGAMFAPCFMAGIIAFALRERLRPTVPAVWWPVFLIGMVVVYIAVEELTEGIHHFLWQAVICMAVGLAIPLFQQSTFALLNRWTLLIARYSYGVYLFHCVALWVGYFRFGVESPALQGLLTLLTLVTLSVAGYHLLEKPAIRLGARLSGKSGRRAEMGTFPVS